MTTFWWVRHGPTHARGLVGWTDLPADLSDTERLARLRDHLPRDAVVVSSDLTRAVATADAIQGARPRLDHEARLREMHFGEWEAKPFAEVERSHPELARAFTERPGTVRPPGGESWEDLAARVQAAVDELAARHAGRHIVAVAHFAVILTQVQRALRMTPQEALGQRIDNLSVTRIRLGEPPVIGPINLLP